MKRSLSPYPSTSHHCQPQTCSTTCFLGLENQRSLPRGSDTYNLTEIKDRSQPRGGVRECSRQGTCAKAQGRVRASCILGARMSPIWLNESGRWPEMRQVPSSSLPLKVQCTGQQRWLQPGAYWKCRSSGLIPDLLSPRGSDAQSHLPSLLLSTFSSSGLRAIGNIDMIKQVNHMIKAHDLEKSFLLQSGGKVGELVETKIEGKEAE